MGSHLRLVAPLILMTFVGCLSAESRMTRGDLLFERGKYDLALEEYRSAQRKDPALIGIEQKIVKAEAHMYLRRGDQAVERSQWEVAQRCYDQVRDLDPTNAELPDHVRRLQEKRSNEHFRSGQQFLGRGNPFDAISEFEQALTFFPDHPRAQESLERAIDEKREREGQAEAEFQEGLQDRSDQNLEEAVRHFTTALNLNPHHPSAVRELEDAKIACAEAFMMDGDTALAREQWVKALTSYRKAQNYNPRLPGLAQRVRRAHREKRAAKLIEEGNDAYESRDWRTAYERFAQAQELTDNKEFMTRFETARDNRAEEVYRDAQRAEREGSLREALSQYRSISQFYPNYRDANDRATAIDVALRTAERTYTAGRRAEEERNLIEAREQYRMCKATISSYQDVAERFENVQRELSHAESLYARGVQAEGRGDHERARVLYEECLTIVTPFRDVPERLTAIRDLLIDRAALHERYEAACQAQSSKDLEQARKLFLTCREEEREYRDVESRLRDVESGIETAYNIYDRAVDAERQSNLKRARALYDECLSISTPCRDAKDRLRRIRSAMEDLDIARKLYDDRRLVEARQQFQLVLDKYSSHTEARRLAERIDSTVERLEVGYEAMVEAQRKAQFSLAYSYAKEIRKQCTGYKDVDERIPLLELEVDYAEGCAFEEREQYDEAIERFRRCGKRRPGFRDVDDRIRSCQARAAASTSPAASSSTEDEAGFDER